jgi:hypothetical protein
MGGAASLNHVVMYIHSGVVFGESVEEIRLYI